MYKLCCINYQVDPVDKLETLDKGINLLFFFPSCPFSMQEGKTIKSSSGFSGKGFKFDETEHALANERKKLQKAALGLQDSDDEDGALDVSEHLNFTVCDWQQNAQLLLYGILSFPVTISKLYSLIISSSSLSELSFLFQIEEQIESMFNSKKRVKDLSAPGSATGSTGTVTSTASVPGGLPGLGPTSAGNIQKLEMAKRLALKINAQKNLGAEAQVRPTEIKCVCAGSVFVFTVRRETSFTC